MKTIKLLERIFLILVVCAIAIGLIIAPFDGMSGTLLTLVVSYSGVLSMFGVFATLLVGIVLHHHKNKTTRYVADVLILAAMIPVIATAIYGIAYEGGGFAVLLLVSTICYAVASVIKLIGYVVVKAKPDMTSELDPENDQKVIYILKWKRLLERGVITEEEFQAKRKAILEFGEEVKEETI
jgi:uncharacterized membrane protein